MPVAIGSAELERIEEQHIPVSFSLLTPAGGGPSAGDGSFQFSNHSWLVQADGLTVLVDPCNGNGRRRQRPFFNDLNLPWLDRLQAAGAAPEDVDIVFCTHLHSDHCGWNTMRARERWVPTFPRAQYLFVEAEYRRWDPDEPHANQYNESVFDECVRPVVAAGRARIITAPFAVSDSLTVETAPGHTAGHALLRLESLGERAYFTGDAFHHPVQVERPELCLPGCDDLGPGGGDPAGPASPGWTCASMLLPLSRPLLRAALWAGRAAGGRLHVHPCGYRGTGVARGPAAARCLLGATRPAS